MVCYETHARARQRNSNIFTLYYVSCLTKFDFNVSSFTLLKFINICNIFYDSLIKFYYFFKQTLTQLDSRLQSAQSCLNCHMYS
ncbi:hypothetical protein HZS_6431 [Henneguya salminicola]|nr:hypothetical protein HZS_6431 [Henneguya salminicola]